MRRLLGRLPQRRPGHLLIRGARTTRFTTASAEMGRGTVRGYAPTDRITCAGATWAGKTCMLESCVRSCDYTLGCVTIDPGVC